MRNACVPNRTNLRPFFPRWKNVLQKSKDPRFSNSPRRNLRALPSPILQTFLGLFFSKRTTLARISSSSRHSSTSLNAPTLVNANGTVSAFFNAILLVRFATKKDTLHGFLPVNDSLVEETRRGSRQFRLKEKT